MKDYKEIIVEDEVQQTEKKTVGEVVSKILAAVCIIAAVVLFGVTILAFVNSARGNNSATGEQAPEIITTTVPTTTQAVTQKSAKGAKVKGTVYAVAEADVMSEASGDSAVLAKLNIGDGIGFISVDKEGWCSIVYNDEICFVHREYLSTEKPVTATTEPAESQSGRKVVDLKQKHWYLVVVDKNREIPEGYVPTTEYVAESEHSLDARIAVYYDAMYKAAYEEGIVLTPYSGYRRYETQLSNYNALVDSYLSQGYTAADAEAKASTETLPAGCSEHNLGYAMDICGTDPGFKDTEEYKWLCENAYIYGFIERYPEGKEDITGVIAEPWHWRFVGPAAAEKMKSEGIATLEELMQNLGLDY